MTGALRYLAAALLAVFAVGGWVGGVGFLVDPSGGVLGMSRTQLPPWPVLSDYTVPGVVLLVGFGVLPIAALILLVRGHRFGWLATAAVGGSLILWMLVQLTIIGLLFPAMQVAFLALGAALLVVGFFCRAPNGPRDLMA